MHPIILSLRYHLANGTLFRLTLQKVAKYNLVLCAAEHRRWVRPFHIQLACACMLLLFLLGLGMRARLLHDWASNGFADEDEYSSSEQFLSLIGLVSARPS